MSGGILCVEILEAKPNKLFTEEQRQCVRFLRFNRRVQCAECGSKRCRVLWTMLCEFKALTMGTLIAIESKRIHPPLTPVCGEHPIAPAWPGKKENA